MNRWVIISIAIALIVLASIPYTVAYAKVEKTYYLVNGDAVVFHRYGVTFNGNDYLVSAMGPGSPLAFKIGPNVTVCVRVFTNHSYEAPQPVVDYGVIYSNTSYWIVEAVPSASYRFLLNTTSGLVSIDVPGEYGSHMYCFSVVTYSDGCGVINAYIDGVFNRSVRFAGFVNITLDGVVAIGGYVNETIGKGFTVLQLLIYSRTLNESEIADIANGVISRNGLVVYFEPTAYYLSYSDLGIVPFYPSLSEVPSQKYFLPSCAIHERTCVTLPVFVDNESFTVVKSMYGDSYVHFTWFPWYSRVEIYDPSGNIVEKFVV
jgi:hypothetical protein